MKSIFDYVAGARDDYTAETVEIVSKVLTYDTRLGGYVVDLTREQLERAPHYALEETPWADPLGL